MEKQIRRFEVPFNFNWTYGVSIEKMREDLDALEKLGAKEILIEAGQDYDYPFVTLEAYVERLETDEELEERLREDGLRRDLIKQRELEHFEKIKLKYGL